MRARCIKLTQKNDFKLLWCIIKDIQNYQTIFIGYKNENIFTINIEKYNNQDKYFLSIHDESWLWHKSLGCVKINPITQLNKMNL